MKNTFVILLLWLFPVIVTSETVHVPGDSATIQSAIDGVNHGDTVLVADGVYTGDGNRDIHFRDKWIVVRSENGMDYTTIDCQGTESEPHKAFIFDGGESQYTILEGFTITGGLADNWGGAIRLDGGGSPGFPSPIIRKCRFIDNHVLGDNHGGCISVGLNADMTIDSCWFINNSANNNAGGAIKLNTGEISGIKTTISNCVFIENSALSGGAIYATGSSILVENCTFIRNFGQQVASVIATYASNSANINECLMVDNKGQPVVGYVDGSADLRCCDVYGNEAGDWVALIADQADLRNNFSAEPYFCDTLNGDYRIYDLSPCAPLNNDCQALVGALGVGCTDYPYMPGDADGDGEVTEADVIFLCNFWFLCSQPPFPYFAGDANCDDIVDLRDIVYLVNYLIGDGPAPDC